MKNNSNVGEKKNEVDGKKHSTNRSKKRETTTPEVKQILKLLFQNMHCLRCHSVNTYNLSVIKFLYNQNN